MADPAESVLNRARLRRLSEVIVLLREKTEEDRLRWRREGDDESRRMTARISGNGVRLEVHHYKKNGSAASDIKVTLLNSDDDVTDIVRDADLESIAPPGKYFTWQLYMSELIELAERRALGSDRVLDDLLTALKGDLEDQETGDRDQREEAEVEETSSDDSEDAEAGPDEGEGSSDPAS